MPELAELPSFPLVLPRNAFSPSERARAGDLWRACQDAAVLDSMRVGWPPSRYREEGTSFIVRSMTARHHRATAYGDRLVARTWVPRVRRDTFWTRQVRIDSEEGVVLEATQEWVHVDAQRSPSRAPPALTRAFSVVTGLGGFVEMPEIVERVDDAPEHTLVFRCWHVWMDPLAHVNHPAYVDFVDELLSSVLARAGVESASLVPVAETARYRAGVTADAAVRVTARLVGLTAGGEPAVAHAVHARPANGAAETLCARVDVVRTTAMGPAPLVAALRGPPVHIGDR